MLRPKQLGQSLLGTVTEIIYTSPAGVFTDLDVAIVCNTDSEERTFSLWLDKDGSDAGDGQAIFSDTTIEAKTTYIIPLKQGIDATGTLSGVADVADTVTVTVTGEVIK